MQDREATPARLVDELRRLGVPAGAVLLVHTSFRAVGPVDGGPRGLIDALLRTVGPRGTLVMPSMTDWDDDRVFDPRRTPCLGMGVVADTFWRHADRSDSPHSFAALGPHAARIVAPHPPEIPHGPDSPVGRVHALDGFVLLLGVDHDANTTIHLGEFMANVPYRVPKYCTVLRGAVPTRVDYSETDHCCRNFVSVGGWLASRGQESVAWVGSGQARLARSKDIVEAVVAELEGDPCRFLCAPAIGCRDCDEARSGTVEPIDARLCDRG